MDASIQLQKQVKDNAEDIRRCLSDLNSWANEMKAQSGANRTSPSSTVKAIPPIRNSSMKRESNDEVGSTAGSKVSKRISSFDYDQWDKFDVEKACEELDREEEKSSKRDLEVLDKACEDLDRKEAKSLKPDLKAQDKAQYEKERGNRYVKNSKWDDAIICYSKAIKCYPNDATFYANRALCYLKKKQYRSVEADCTVALQLEADYVKALQRRAAARRELNQLEDALQDLKTALFLEPDNTALKADLTLLKQKLTSSSASKPKTTQEREPLKWLPPSGVESRASASATNLTQKSAPINSPVVVEPAKKHLKSDLISVGKGVETLSLKKSEGLEIKEVSDDTPEIPAPTSRIKWFSKEGTTVVHPVIKLPHRRSKEPLKRIPIKERPNYDLLANLNCASKEILKKEGKTTSVTPSTNELKENVSITKEILKPGAEELKKIYQSEPSETEADLPVPSTSVQFIATWKLIHTKPHLCSQFLKKIPASELPKIFQECLESDLLSGIISTLESEFTRENVPVYGYLMGLGGVKRFSMLTMFLSATDKKRLLSLFDHCRTQEGCTEEEVNNLKKIYEL